MSDVPGPRQEFEDHPKMPTTHAESERTPDITGLPDCGK